MQGIQVGFSRIWVTQLPISAAANAHRVVSFALSHPSLLNRSRRAVVAWRWHEEPYSGGDSSPFFEEKQRAYHESAATSLQVWRRSRASSRQIAFERYSIPLRQRRIMTTMSIAATHEGGGRQLRRRKETHISLSSTKEVTNSSVVENKQNRKKSAKAAAPSSPPVDDHEDAGNGGEDPFAGSLEAKLWNLYKTDQLTSLTVVELRGLMKQISKPTAGRKEELISEVKRWIAERKAVAIKGDGRRGGTRESSSDAESLEGALLKAESKARMAPMPHPNGEGITTKYPQKLAVEVDPPVPDVKPKASRKAAAVDSSDEDFEPQVEEKKKTTKPRKGKMSTKVEKVSEESAEDEGDVKAVAVVRKRKTTKVTKTVQAKKTKLNEEDEETPLAVAAGEAWKILAHKKPQSDWVVYNPYEMRPAPPPPGSETVKLVSWNVNGLRALMKDKINKKQESLLLANFAKEENFDVLCLQETKLQEKDIEEVGRTVLAGYFDDTFWSCSTSKLGYSGTAVFSKVKPVSVAYGMGIIDHDAEGRLITVEFDSFFLLTTYVPNSGEKLDRLSYRTEEWDIALSKYIKGLEEQKPVILTGDLNCANEPIDIYNPDGNKKSAGYTQEERTSFKTNFLEQGLVDTFRRQHPNVLGYSYWGYRSGARAKNQGWRLDYFLVSEALVDKVHDSYICPDVLGSDHCPIGLILNL